MRKLAIALAFLIALLSCVYIDTEIDSDINISFKQPPEFYIPVDIIATLPSLGITVPMEDGSNPIININAGQDDSETSLPSGTEKYDDGQDDQVAIITLCWYECSFFGICRMVCESD